MGVLSLFERFYDAASTGPPAPGDIYWVPIPETNEVPRLLDVKRADARNHIEIGFELCEIGARHFKARPDRLPVKMINLRETEELIATKAKMRPALVLFATGACDLMALPGQDQRLGKSLNRGCYIVAPMYSPATQADPSTFMPTMVARIRVLRYPHFACLPRLGKNETTPGEIVRLDRLHTSYLGRGSNSTGFRLNDEVFELIVDQLVWTATGQIRDYLKEVADAVADKTVP